MSLNSTRLHVGNIAYSLKESDIRDLFQQYGTVQSVRVIVDRVTMQSKGYGFVQMGTVEEAESALNSLNNYEFHGRSLHVSEALPRKTNS